MTDCRRTSALRDRTVAGTLTPDDAVHAASCAECGPVLARAARFDDELRRAARGLITEELPRGILDPGLAPVNESSWQPRRAGSGLATAVAAVVVLLLATLVALVPGAPPQPTEPAPSALESPGKSPGPPGFRPTSLIRASLAKIDYSCNDGQSLPSVGSGPDAVVREAAVCTAPGDIGPLIAAVIVGEASRGAVIEVVVKSDIMGTDTQANREQVAAAVGRAVAITAADELDGAVLGSWVVSHLPELLPGQRADVVLRGYRLDLDRSPGGSYLLVVRAAPGT